MNASAVEAFNEAILNLPALTPPPGIQTNFSNPDIISKYTIPVVCLALFLTTAAMSARLYTKVFLIRSVGWEDYTALIGYVLFCAYCVPNVAAAARHDAGGHQWNYTYRSLFDLLFWCYVGQIIYAPAIFFVKLSILLQYLRIFVPSRQGSWRMYIAIQVVLWANAAFYVADLLVKIFSCSPIAYTWNKLIPNGHCININAVIDAAAAINVVSDFAILLLPVWRVWNLQMSKKRKIGLTAVFGTGFFACVVSIVRLYYSVVLTKSDDVTWWMARVAYFEFAEIAIGIIICCLPTIPKFVQVFVPKLSQSTLGRYSFLKKSTAEDLYARTTNKSSKATSNNKGADTWSSLPHNINSQYQELDAWQDSRRELCTVDIAGSEYHENTNPDLERGQILRTFSVEVVKNHNDQFLLSKELIMIGCLGAGGSFAVSETMVPLTLHEVLWVWECLRVLGIFEDDGNLK